MRYLLTLMLASVILALSGIFVVDQQESAIVSFNDGSTREYSAGIYWRVPLYGDATYVSLNKRATELKNMPFRFESGIDTPVDLLVLWQVADPEKYVGYLKDQKDIKFSEQLRSISVDYFRKSWYAHNQNLAAMIADKAPVSLSIESSGIKITGIEVLGVGVESLPLEINPTLMLVESVNSFESQYNIALAIKESAEKNASLTLQQLERKNKDFYDYFMLIESFKEKAQDKSQIPSYGELVNDDYESIGEEGE